MTDAPETLPEHIVALILAGAITAAWEGGAEPGPGDANLKTRTAEVNKDGTLYKIAVTVEPLDG
jgi:hypothetical protein